MRTRITWFILGFVVSWVTWSAINWTYGHARDQTQLLPEELADFAPEWVKDAVGRRVGQFNVMASAEPSEASAWVYPVKKPQNLIIFLDDCNSDGGVDGVGITAADGTSLSFDDSDYDGQFDSHGFTSSGGTDSQMRRDYDMDGTYDYLNGPEGVAMILIDSEWHELVRKDDKWYVNLNGKLVEVTKPQVGAWKIVK
jgi:hypothetical protein